MKLESFYSISFQAVSTDTRILLCLIFCLFLETLSLSCPCVLHVFMRVCVNCDSITQSEVGQYLWTSL